MHARAYLGPAVVPPLDSLLSFCQRGAPIFGQAVRRLAVGNAEVQDLGLAALPSKCIFQKGHWAGAIILVGVPFQNALPCHDGAELWVGRHAEDMPMMPGP